MAKPVNTLLPYVLDLLSRSRNSISIDKICEEIKRTILFEHISPFGTLQSAVEFALELGNNMGLISLQNERKQVPYAFRKKKSALVSRKSVQPSKLRPKHPTDAVKKKKSKHPASRRPLFPNLLKRLPFFKQRSSSTTKGHTKNKSKAAESVTKDQRHEQRRRQHNERIRKELGLHKFL